MKKRRYIWVPADLKKDFEEYAYENRTTVSELTRGFVVDYALGRTPELMMSDEPYWGNPKAKLKFTTTEEDWNTAQARAATEGVRLPKLLRARIEAEL